MERCDTEILEGRRKLVPGTFKANIGTKEQVQAEQTGTGMVQIQGWRRQKRNPHLPIHFALYFYIPA